MAIQVTSEERLRLKIRARQRLLGAIVLLVSMAIILPLLLDQAPRPLGADVVIDMPQSAVAPAKPVNPVAAASAGAPQPAPAANGHDNHTSPGVAVRNDTSTHAAPATVAPVAELPAFANEIPDQKAASTQNKPHAAPATATPEKIVRKTAQRSAPTDAKPVKQADVHAHYVVQLGVFSDAANVRQLRARLKTVGVTTYTESRPGGSTRVRAGPYSTRAEADKTLAKISMAGIQAQIVPLPHQGK